MNGIAIDFTNALAEAVGEKNGIGLAELAGLQKAAAEIHADLSRKRAAGEMAFFDLPGQDLSGVLRLAAPYSEYHDNVVVLGIGGSALGPRALAKALLPPWPELRDRAGRGGKPRLLVADNIDPDNFSGLLSVLELKRTAFVVISKSGGTAETMSQFLIIRDLLINQLGEEGYRERMVAVTDAKKGYLRQIVDRDRLQWAEVPAAVGGRFSVFTPVGLLPAAMAGIDVAALLAGAAEMDRRTREPDLMKNPAYLLAALCYLADARHGKNILVMMPYASSLDDLAEWFQQLWAESLGKAVHLDGSPAGVGSTPTRALGATDQHSQVQLYMEGPKDKLVIFLRVESFAEEGPIPEAFADIEGVGYLGGHRLSELINVEELGTELALTKAGRPNLRIDFPEVSARTLGQAMYLMEVATVFAGGLYRINPLDQPGVELGKRYAFSMMGRQGFEKEREEVAAWKQSRGKYRV